MEFAETAVFHVVATLQYASLREAQLPNTRMNRHDRQN